MNETDPKAPIGKIFSGKERDYFPDYAPDGRSQRKGRRAAERAAAKRPKTPNYTEFAFKTLQARRAADPTFKNIRN